MGLISEIEKMLNSANSSIDYRIINVGGNKLYVEGIKAVVCFSLSELRFQLKRKLLIVKGENLIIKYLDKSTSIINGEIKAVELQ